MILGPNQNVTPQSNNGNVKKEEITAGENIKPSKIPSRSRSSADTVIVETCYETAEDIQKDLESPTGDKENGGTKSLRDCITYSEPLTPMLQEVLDDFQSETENEPDVSEMDTAHSEPTDNSANVQQEISKNNTGNEKSNNIEHEKTTESRSVEIMEKQLDDKQPKLDVSRKEAQESASAAEDPEDHKDPEADAEVDPEDDPEILCVDDSPTEDNEELNPAEEEELLKDTRTEPDQAAVTNVTHNTENTDTVIVQDSTENSELIVPSGGLPDTNTTDASLPNNPEALQKRISDEKGNVKPTPTEHKTETKVSRKRSNSESLKVTEKKKTRLEKNKKKAASETEGKKADDTSAKIKSKNVAPKVGSSKDDSIEPSNSKSEADNSKGAQNLAKIMEKQSTSQAEDVNQVLLTSDSEKGEHGKESSQIKNPCLENLSLFEEQLNKQKYNMSESSDVEQKKKTKATVDKKESEKEKENGKEKDVVILKSHSESESGDPSPPKKKHRAGVTTTKKDRDRALSHVFGFASGKLCIGHMHWDFAFTVKVGYFNF